MEDPQMHVWQQQAVLTGTEGCSHARKWALGLPSRVHGGESAGHEGLGLAAAHILPSHS